MGAFSAAPVVLCFGYEFSLLLTRQWMLERVGCNVLCAMNLTEFRERLCSTHVDLVILCHTLSPGECVAVIQLVQERSPVTRCLAMYNTLPPWKLNPGVKLLCAREGPVQFTRTVQQILEASLPYGGVHPAVMNPSSAGSAFS